MRILYFADIRFPLERANGIQTMETCHALASLGHEVRLVVRPDTHVPARDPFEYYGVPRSGRLIVESAPIAGPQFARRTGYLAFALGRSIGAGRTDVVLTRDLGTADLLLRIPRAVRAPLIFESHGYAPQVAAALPELVSTAPRPSRRKLDRLAAREAVVWRRAEGYVTITSGLARALEEELGPRSRLAIVPDGVRSAALGDPGPPPADAPPVAGYAGHLYPWKGVDVLLQAIALLNGVSALIVGGHDGDADRGRLESLTAQLGIRHRVTFVGHRAPGEVAGLLRRASILVLPNPESPISTHFTSPLKLFEYMAAGRAIVASDLPSIREVLNHDQNAVLVRPGDPQALAAGIQRLAGNPALAAKVARQAFADAADYTWQRRAERLTALFDAVLAAG